MRRIVRVTPVLWVVASFGFLPTAYAGGWHGLGRYLGVGWGDGYHAPVCPPHRACRAPAPAAVPWWMLPATAEPLPATLPLPEPARAGERSGSAAPPGGASPAASSASGVPHGSSLTR
jgi:hypothetical protein